MDVKELCGNCLTVQFVTIPMVKDVNGNRMVDIGRGWVIFRCKRCGSIRNLTNKNIRLCLKQK